MFDQLKYKFIKPVYNCNFVEMRCGRNEWNRLKAFSINDSEEGRKTPEWNCLNRKYSIEKRYYSDNVYFTVVKDSNLVS